MFLLFVLVEQMRYVQNVQVPLAHYRGETHLHHDDGCMGAHKDISLLVQVPSLSIVLELIQQDKNERVRSSCVSYAQLALALWSAEFLESFLGDLEQALASGLADACADARVASRSMFETLDKRYPQRAEALFATLSDASKKAISSSLVDASYVEMYLKVVSSAPFARSNLACNFIFLLFFILISFVIHCCRSSLRRILCRICRN